VHPILEMDTWTVK